MLLVNGMALLAVLASSSSWTDIAQRMTDISALLQPVLLSTLLLLFAVNPLLAKMLYWRGAISVLTLAGLVTLGIYNLGGELYAPLGDYDHFHAGRNALLGGVVAALLLAYFRLRARALSPALQGSRLQALHARIRPHFLFNTINAVLGIERETAGEAMALQFALQRAELERQAADARLALLTAQVEPHFLFNTINAVLGIVRADPKRAETALEDMSDLFRMAMASSGNLVPVRQEVTRARQYLALEQLRLGERLKVSWHMEELPEDALLPPLILQPLLENAVYHGIEPLIEGGLIDVRLYRSSNEIHLEMYNPRQEQGDHHIGNKMALTNIRERLALQFDIEASYSVESGKDFYRVHIMLPYVKEETQ